MATTGHETELINVQDLKAALQKFKTDKVDVKADLVDGVVPAEQLPSYIDDIVELNAMQTSAPSTCAKGDWYFNTSNNKLYKATSANTWGSTAYNPEKSKIYFNKADDKSFRWSGSTMVEIHDTLSIGTSTGTAADGKVVDDHIKNTSNPHGVTASQVGLGNVTNNKQVKGLASGTTADHVVTWGSDGYTVKDSGKTIGASVPSDAVFTDTTYSPMVASGTSHAGGLVPDTPSTAGTTKFLREDGTWEVPAASVTYGTTAGTACEGNDSRLSNARVASNQIASYAAISANTSGVTTSLTIDGAESKIYYNSGSSTVTVSFATSGLIFVDGNDSMEIPAGGYGEVNFLRITTSNTTRIFVRSAVSE